MSMVPRSPTALDRTIDLSQPEWKRELIRQKNLRKRSLIRLPTLMIERERKISSATNGDPNSPAPAPALAHNTPDFKAPKPNSANSDGMNGFPRSKSSITLNNNQSIKSLPNLRSQSFENDIQIISSQLETTDGKSKQQNNMFLENSIANNFNQGSSFSGRKTPPPPQPTSPMTTWQQFLNRNKDVERYKSGEKVEMKNGGRVGFELNLELTKNHVSGMNGNSEEYSYEEEDNDSVNDYGPGIVNRMKAKFINLSVQPDPPAPITLISPASPVPILRQSSSLEDLLDIESGDELEDRSELGSGFVARKKDLFKHNANAIKSAFNFLPRARSMDLLTMNADQNPYINQNHLKKAAMGSKKIIIIEQSKPLTEDAVDSSTKKIQRNSVQNNSVPDLGRSLSLNVFDRNEDLPNPKSVLECVKFFQQTDEAKFVFSKPLYDNNVVVVAATTAVKVPPIPPPLPTQASKPNNKPSQVIILDEKVIKKIPPKLSHEPNIIINNEILPNKLIEIEQSSTGSVKSLREAYVNNINAQPLKPNLSSASPEPVIIIEKPKVVTEIPKPVKSFLDEAAIAPSPPKTKPPVPVQQTNFNVPLVSKPNPKKPPLTNGHGSGQNTIVINFKDEEKDRSHLPIIDDEEVPNFTQQGGRATSMGSMETDDDVMGESLHSKSVNFIGANIIVGRSSLLKTRNKKLQLLFDDKALSTYEYPSEWTLLNERSDENEDCDNTPKSDEPKRTNNSSPTASGGISNYTPMTLSKDQVFELGMSPISQIESTRSLKNSTNAVGHPHENGDSELSFKPGDECENVFWSNTQTVDILF